MVLCRDVHHQRIYCDLRNDFFKSPRPSSAKKKVIKTDTCVFANSSPKRTRELLVEGVSFFVDPDFMAQSSEYFRALFGGDFMEKNMEKIELKGESATVFHAVLCVIGADLSYVDVDVNGESKGFYGFYPRNALGILRFAEKYIFEGLRENCWTFIGLVCNKRFRGYRFNINQAIDVLNHALNSRMQRKIILDIADFIATFNYDVLHLKKLYDRVSSPAIVAAIFTASKGLTKSKYRYNHTFFYYTHNSDWECEECSSRGNSKKISKYVSSLCCHYCMTKTTQFCKKCADRKLATECEGSIVDRLFFMDF